MLNGGIEFDTIYVQSYFRNTQQRCFRVFISIIGPKMNNFEGYLCILVLDVYLDCLKVKHRKELCLKGNNNGSRFKMGSFPLIMNGLKCLF